MRPWEEVNRTHRSTSDKKREVEKGYVRADYAVAHLVREMRRRGHPGIQDIPHPHTVQGDRGWLHEGRLRFADRSYLSGTYRLIIQRDGGFWATGQHHDWIPHFEIPSRWNDSFRLFTGKSFVFNRVGFHPEAPPTDPCGFQLGPFQLLMIEIIKKYKLPLPPD